MYKEKRLVPVRRFKTFINDGYWKEVKLGNLLEYEQPTKYIVNDTDYDDSYDIPVLTAGQSFILGYTNEKRGLYRASSTNPVLIFDDFTTSFHYVDFPFKVKSSAMKMLKLKDNTNNIYFVFNSMKNINYVPENHERHWISIFSKFNLFKPNYEEQTKIGELFKKMDSLINLQQQKITKLKDLKSAYLNDMFPKEGDNVPKLRFADFDGDWKKVVLDDISDMYQPKTIGRNVLSDSGVPVFGANGYIGYYFKSNHKSDQVTISARGENSGNPSYVIGPVWITGNSMVINVDNTNICKLFLYNLLLTLPLKTYVTGGAQPQITRESLKSVPISLPSYPEQIKIGQFFKNLDNQIKLQEVKLNKLKQTKKAYLKEMFV